MTIKTLDVRDVPGPRYKAMVNALERAIMTKQLRPGERLPTQREVAYQLGVSVQTVSRAYAEAQRRGLISGEVGRGTFVQYFSPEPAASYITDSAQANVFDFSNVMPVVSELHVEALKEAFGELAKDAAIPRVLEYRPTQGIAPHRQAGVAWLERNGVEVGAESVVVTNGGAHGIWTAIASLVEPGDVIATEALVDIGAITTASILKARLRGLEIDEEGVIPEAFEEACAREPVKLLCVTPCYSNPTASFMGEARREQIAEIARRHDVAIVEDDVFGPLTPDRPKPIWRFAPERTYYVTSFSKAVMASLRAGYLVGPAAIVPRLISRVRVTGWMANTWTAEVAARWLLDGTADRLIAWQRRKLKTRNEILTRTLAEFRCATAPYAMHAWLTLPEPWRARHLVEQARARGILLTPPDPFIVGRATDPHAVRLALGDTNRNDREFQRGLECLATLLREEPEPLSPHF
jgi:DNA-binding transcriptional MocR family regulator